MDTDASIIQGVNLANIYCKFVLHKAKHGITVQHAINRKVFFQGDRLKVKNQIWEGKKGRQRHLQNRQLGPLESRGKSVCVCFEPKETRLPLVSSAE